MNFLADEGRIGSEPPTRAGPGSGSAGSRRGTARRTCSRLNQNIPPAQEGAPWATTTGEVTSKDGTRIVFDRTGDGPPVILVGGALSDRRAGAGFAAELAPDLRPTRTTGGRRGDGGDAPPYAVEREVEDLDALIREAGGRAFLFGVSSGAGLVLETAARSGGADKLAVYEPPYIVEDGGPRILTASSPTSTNCEPRIVGATRSSTS